MELVDLLIIFGVPLVLVSLLVLPFLRVGVDLADEGYLVFGTASLLDGNIPIRDFRAYDPGRYYWCGLFALIVGRGYFATRIAMAVMMVIALSLLMSLIMTATGEALIGALSCGLALIWMQPRAKQIENCFVILSVLLLFNLTQDGTSFDYAALGATIGLSAFFGLNILVYICASSVLVGVLAAGSLTAASLSSFAAGLGLGLLPVLAMVLMAKGYAREYWRRKVVALHQRGSANLKLPLPWLWARGGTGFDLLSPARRRAFKTLFTLMPVLFLGGLSLPLMLGANTLTDPMRLVVAASGVGLVSFHHAVSRADLGHIFQPVLCLAMALTGGIFAFLGPVGVVILLCPAVAGSVALVWTQQFHLPEYRKIRHALRPFDCATDRLWLPAGLAAQMDQLQQIVQELTAKGEPILAVPVQIGLCTLFDRSHAAYDSFPVYPSEASARRTMMEDLERCRPKLLLIGTMALDRREDLIFLNNYPNVAALIAAEYLHLDTIGRTAAYVRSDVQKS